MADRDIEAAADFAARLDDQLDEPCPDCHNTGWQILPNADVWFPKAGRKVHCRNPRHVKDTP